MLASKTIQNLDKRDDFFRRAAAFDGRTRERMIALAEADELFFRLYPYHYRSMQIIRVASMLGKTTCDQAEGPGRPDNRSMRVLSGIIQEAIRDGDLTLQGPRRPEEIAFTLWAISFGARAIMDSSLTTGQLGIEDPYEATRVGIHALLDAFGWQPYSHEWDYGASRRRIRETVFAEEMAELAAREKTIAFNHPDLAPHGTG